jgi:eukaryotic-like serine/threonine-protein kinase
VLKAMAKSPADRYQTAADMRADLQRAASGLPVAAAPPTRVDMYPNTQRMGADPMTAGRTSAIPPVADYDYAGAGYDGGRGGGGHRWIPWVLGLVLVLGVVLGVAYYLLSGGKTYSVPLVDNLPVATAQQEITANHLRSAVVDQASNSVQKGRVISSNPAQGNNVAANTLVTLYVSTGAAPVAVPNVVGESETSAQSALQAKQFQVSVKPDPTSTQPSGTVVSQSPSGGTAPLGSTVTITVSGGAVQVPTVVGDSQQTANQVLTSAGFAVNVQQGSGPSQYANGTVFTQQPGAGSTEPKGTTITIFVQNGASPSGSPSAPASPTASPSASGGILPGF